jgi:hypothetical protein
MPFHDRFQGATRRELGWPVISAGGRDFANLPEL